MIILVLVLLGLGLGSFVNALVWRIHQKSSDKSKNIQKRYSIISGRSMCVNCKHELAAKDLIPIYSWISLGGKCRYCKKPISRQYPVVEISTALLFVISYLYWPLELVGLEVVVFGFWLAALVAFMALVVYDIRWTLLPNRIVLWLYIFAVGYSFFRVIDSVTPSEALVDIVISILIGGGIFYLIFQVSKGAWIGGGDVKLGFALGAFTSEPQQAFLMLFIASVLGTIYSIPLMLFDKLSRKSRIAFGPFLILATIVVVLFGEKIIDLYLQLILPATF